MEASEGEQTKEKMHRDSHLPDWLDKGVPAS